MAEARKTAKKTAAKKTTARKTAAKKSEQSSAAEKRTPARKAAATSQSRGDGARSGRTSSGRTSPLRVAAAAAEQLAALTGKPSEGVVGIERDGDGQWVVEIEVLEVRRVPSTTDVLARYQVTADDGGDVTGYHRLGRYVRGNPGGE